MAREKRQVRRMFCRIIVALCNQLLPTSLTKSAWKFFLSFYFLKRFAAKQYDQFLILHPIYRKKKKRFRILIVANGNQPRKGRSPQNHSTYKQICPELTNDESWRSRTIEAKFANTLKIAFFNFRLAVRKHFWVSGRIRDISKSRRRRNKCVFRMVEYVNK